MSTINADEVNLINEYSSSKSSRSSSSRSLKRNHGNKGCHKKRCPPAEICLEPFQTCVPDKWIDVPEITIRPDCETVQGKSFYVTARFKVTPPAIVFQPKELKVKPKDVLSRGGKIWVKPPEVLLHPKYEQKPVHCGCDKDF